MSRVSDVAVSCGVGGGHSLDPALLWLWCRLAAAALMMPPLAQELPYATLEALKEKKKERKIFLVNSNRKGSSCSSEGE